MYLIINDKNCLTKNSIKRFVSNTFYERILKVFPQIKDIKKENVEEILIYYNSKEDDFNCKVANCDSINHQDNSIEIVYNNIEPIEESSKSINKRLYRWLFTQGLINKDNHTIPFITLIDNYQVYMDIKSRENEIKFESFNEQISRFKSKNDWMSIINLFPKEDKIEESDIWDNIYCLAELNYSLSKIVDDYSKKNRNNRLNYNQYFLKVANRCIELEPNIPTHKSILAYYYYTVTNVDSRNFEENYNKAIELYEWLIINSKQPYKEFYRYTRLQNVYYDNIKFKDNKKANEYENEILKNYNYLIDFFDNLEKTERNKCKKEYIKALYNYCKFYFDNKLDCYKYYCDKVLYGQKINIKNKDINEIPKLENYLNQIINICNYDDIKKVSLQDKPSYLDVYYRLAQLEQIKGLIYKIKDKDFKENYFENSNNYVDRVLNMVKIKKDREKFLFPKYVFLIKAVNLYFLNKIDECHKCFRGDSNYMNYEEAVIYAMEGDILKSKNILSKIPQKDLCYNKSQKLIEKLNQHGN